MTNKKALFFALFSLLTVMALMGSLAVKAPAKAAGEQEGLSTWMVQKNSLASQAAAPEAVCTPDTSSMSSYWPLDETSGTTFTDVVDGNHGACTEASCPVSVAGIVGGAQQFESADGDGILISEDPLNPLTWGNEESFSFEMWVNFTETCTGKKVFFGRYLIPGGDPEATWWVGCADGGFPRFRLTSVSSPAVEITDDVAINDGVWHHIVAVRDGSAGSNLLYIDGTEAISTAATYGGGFSSSGPIFIGEYTGGYNLDGQIDEVAVYDKALSPEEVANHYNGGTGQSYCSVPPVAQDQSVTTDEDVAADITLVATDDDNDELTFSVVEGPANGTLSGTAPALTYTPDDNYSGSDSFTFKANDGSADSNLATVSITVKPVNDPPETVAQFVTTEEDAPVDITLEATDTENDPLTFSVVDAPLHGILSGTAPALTYTPDADYYGTDSFTFKANDGTDDSNVATVSITIDAGPDAVDDSLATDENASLDFTEADLLANDSHPEAEAFGITVVDAASVEGGTITDMGGGNYRYSPPVDFAGTDSFTYTVEDESGGSDTATVTITVTGVGPGQIMLYLPQIVKGTD